MGVFDGEKKKHHETTEELASYAKTTKSKFSKTKTGKLLKVADFVQKIALALHPFLCTEFKLFLLLFGMFYFRLDGLLNILRNFPTLIRYRVVSFAIFLSF